MLTTTRRGFLGLMIGGVAAGAAVRSWPFRVFSFPEQIQIAPGPLAVRFVRLFDPLQMRMITRFDALYGAMWSGHELALPQAVEAAEVITAKQGETIPRAVVEKFKEDCLSKWSPHAKDWKLLVIPNEKVDTPNGEVIHKAWEIPEI